MPFLGSYNYGFSKPYIAKYNYDESAGTVSYTDGFTCGEGVNTSIAPAYANAKLYGDNKVCEEINEFVNAEITLGVTRMPLKAAEVLFGHTIDDTEGLETSNGNDVANFVGYGFTAKNSDGTYDACVLLKVKFSEAADTYNTKEDSITFKKPNLNGSAITDDVSNDWRKKKYGFTTEALAEAWVKTQLGGSAS